ncbi:phytanoyl-CoA dioxygenase family protein [Sphingomonas sp.]|uniref:phytanoyl-CoA dioxygenase family protein n=1 Tax=Sphingomonas sp. TaxID=28214 RepID=UPI0035BBE558
MLTNGLLRDVTEEEVATYERDGVVRLRGILAPDLIARLGQGINDALYGQWEAEGIQTYDASATADQLDAAGVAVLSDARAKAIPQEKRGRFVSMIGANTINADIRALAVDSPLPYIAARLFRTDKVNFYDDQTLMKEPGTREYTAFHTDEPYYHLSGDQVCGMWVSPDVVTEDSGAMRYVRGSHRWGTFFKANVFVSQTSIGDLMPEASDEDNQVQLPDIEGNPDQYDILTYPSEPGDVIVHHSNLIHGSGPNYRGDVTRRAVSFRYAGEDVRYRFHRSVPPQPHHTYDLKDGDRIDSEQFPIVWRAE